MSDVTPDDLVTGFEAALAALIILAVPWTLVFLGAVWVLAKLWNWRRR